MKRISFFASKEVVAQLKGRSALAEMPMQEYVAHIVSAALESGEKLSGETPIVQGEIKSYNPKKGTGKEHQQLSKILESSNAKLISAIRQNLDAFTLCVEVLRDEQKPGQNAKPATVRPGNNAAEPRTIDSHDAGSARGTTEIIRGKPAEPRAIGPASKGKGSRNH